MLNNQIINRTSKQNFDVFWDGVRDSFLHLNFTPVIQQFNLTGNFALLHWQAKPKYYRRWGLYYAPHDYYYSFNYNELLIECSLDLQTLQINEAKWKAIPTAVVLLQPVTLEIAPEVNGYRLNKNGN